MAKPISAIEIQNPNPLEEKAEAFAEIGEKIAVNREAVIKMLEILQELQASGVLDIAFGLLKSREKVGSIAIEQLNQPKFYHVIKNVFQLIGTLQTEQLEMILAAVNKGIEQMEQPEQTKKSLSLWGMMKAVRDPYINSTLSMTLNFLHGVGKSLEEQKQMGES